MSSQITVVDTAAESEAGLHGLAAALSFCIALGVVIAVDYAIAKNHIPRTAGEQFPAVYLPVMAPYAIGDEVDKYLYIVGTFLFPLMLIPTLFVVQKCLCSGRFAGSWLGRFALRVGPWALLLAVGMLVLIGLLEFRLVGYLQHNWFARHPIWSIPLSALFLYLLVRSQGDPRKGVIAGFVADALAIAVLCVLFVFSLFDEGYMLKHPLSQSFNAVYHTAVQVYHGKGILVNHLHQYGLYPHFLHPVFKVIGLSVFKYSLVMQSLTLLEFSLAYLFLRRVVRHRLIAWLGLMVLASGVMCAWVYGSETPVDGVVYGFVYYQYLPIRTFFPALFLYLTGRYIETPGTKLYYGSFLLYSIGCLWNMDTGTVVFFAWLLTLGYLELMGATRQTAGRVAGRIVRHALTGALMLAVVTACYALAIYIGYGAWPDFHVMTRYQDLFYRHGFFMLPMPLVHPWNLLILIYMAGLTVAFSCLASGRGSAESATVFMLSVLGVGVFSYYQGRSHNDVFIGVTYPAVLLVCLCADWLSRSLTRDWKQLPRKALAVLALYLMFSSVPTLCGTLRGVYTQFQTQLGDAAGGRLWRADQAFLHRVVQPGDDVLVLGFQRTGIYHQVIGKPCPVDVPGLLELVSVEDLDKVYEFIRTDGQKKIILSQFDVLSPMLVELARELYATREVVGINERFICFGPRAKNPPRKSER